MMQQTLRASPSVKKRAKSVYQQRNLGTIKDRKKQKQEVKEVSNGETILRILRMRYVPGTDVKWYRGTDTDHRRPGTSDFIAQQLFAMNNMQAEREAQSREAQKRKLQRPRQQQADAIPPVPPVPPVPTQP